MLHEAGMPILAVNDMRETLLACDTLLNFDRAEIAGAFAVLSSVALGDDGATAMHEQRSAMDETSALLHGFMCNTPLRGLLQFGPAHKLRHRSMVALSWRFMWLFLLHEYVVWVAYALATPSLLF